MFKHCIDYNEMYVDILDAATISDSYDGFITTIDVLGHAYITQNSRTISGIYPAVTIARNVPLIYDFEESEHGMTFSLFSANARSQLKKATKEGNTNWEEHSCSLKKKYRWL